MNDDMEQYDSKLDELPVREPTHRHRPPKRGCTCRWCVEKRGDDYPHDRVRRWLLGSIGTRWNDVIADFVRLEWVPARYRTYTKLCEHVDVNTFMEDGKVWFYRKYSGGMPTLIEEEYSESIYVDPRTKDLCYKKKTPRTRWSIRSEAEERKTMRILGDYHQLLRINGIWYEVKGAPEGIMFSARKYGPKTRMMWDKPDKRNYSYMNHCWERPRIVLKRQLSGEELKRLGLTNVKDGESTRTMHYAQTSNIYESSI